MNTILGVYTELDEVTNLQCDYLELLKKCEGLETELSNSKMMSKRFEALHKYAINLEIDLQQCQEKIKNDKSFTENLLKEFRKERKQYFGIQDLKAQLQDKGIVISELKKLIEKLKGKSVDTKFEKSSVIRQPNAFKSQRPSVLGKLTTFSNSFVRKDFLKSKSVTQNNVSNDFSKPVTAQTLPPNKKSILKNMNVLAPGKPHLKSNTMGDRVMRNKSQGKNQEVEDQRRSVKFSQNKMFVTASALESNQKPRNITRKLYERISKACSWWYPKFTPSGYKWKPKSGKENVNPNTSMPLGSVSRTANILEHMTSRLVQRGLQAYVRIVRTDKGKEFLNQNLHVYFAAEGIHHQMSIARTPEQNDVVERRNRTLVEAARTMLSTSKVPLFFWAESRAYRVFNKRTRVIMESIHVNFDELPQMASDHVSSDPAPECQRMALEHDSLSPVIQRQENVPQADRTSSVVSSADAHNQRQQHTTPLNNHTTYAPTCQVPTLAPTVSSYENINQAKTYAENDQVADDEFINIFCTPVQNQGETSSRH
nr:ribonuclease H-like domain-containing protein [Tanacetum cinerariifolium]